MLNWIGKEAVIKHHKEVPFQLVEPVPELSCGDADSGNLIVQGDNLLALKALLPRYAGQVKCIYIDPPYNTGNEGWVYNDNVNSPEIRKWLGEVVGKEGETLDRHDRWLCMMYPRLVLLKQFLREDGSIWISMDESEIAHLRCLMDDVFGRQRFVACNAWQKRYSRENRGAIGDVHEYVLVYAMSTELFQATRNRVPIDEKQAAIYKNPNNDPKGRWRGIPMTAQGYRPNQMYEIETPSGRKIRPPEGRCWSTIESEFLKLKAAGRVYFGKNGNSQPNIIRYLSEVEGFVPWTWWPHEEVGHTDESRKEIQDILGTQTAFDTPKPTRLIQRILQIATDKDSIVLDSFAGSGTTGHAVLKQNAEDGGKRRFILVEMDENIACSVTAERVRRVCSGYTNANGKEIEGLGGGFQFCRLSDKPLFKADGPIRADVTFAQPVVMLIQAERQAKEKETFTPERVKQHLIEDFNLPPETIAIATGNLDELSGKKLDDPDYPQFIITVDKLREGWDCPYAYVLFSFRNTTSATAVEQVLGRVLRMPHVTRKQREALNRSYAYVVSSELATTVQSLRDGLVQSGFERLETKDLIRTPDDAAPMGDLFAPQGDLVIPLPEVNEQLAVPDETALASLPKALRNKVEISPESGTLTLKGGGTGKQIQQLAETFKQPEAAKAVRERLDTALAIQSAPPARMPTPAERGESARVPLLGYTQYSFFEVFDETPLLDADWEITDFDPKLSEAEFAYDVEATRRASLSISQLEKIECDVYDRLDSQLALFSKEDGWQVIDLIYWLDRNLYFPYSERDQKVAWLSAALDHLLETRGFSLDELAYRKFRLRGALERKMAAGLVRAKQQVFDELFADESRFAVRDEYSIALEQGRYAYDFQYTGFIPLKRHFFPVIGNLKNTGEEFECAEFIADQLEGIEWWVRNVERKATSFWLQTASGRFYPDFLLKMQDGPLVAIEYKGAHIADSRDSRDSREKKRVGDLWARRSDGRCRFVWVENRNWQAIRDAVK